MKKFISLGLCLATILCMSVPAMAKTNTVVLSFVNEASYEIEIPTECAISEDGTGVIRVQVTDVNVAETNLVHVQVSGSYDDMTGNWYLTNTENENDKIPYSLKIGDDYLGTFKSVLATDSAQYVDIDVIVSNTEGKVGTYTDTLTFTSYIDA